MELCLFAQCGEQWSIRDWADPYIAFICLSLFCLFSSFFLTDSYDFWVRLAVVAVAVIVLLWIFSCFFILQIDASLYFCPVSIIFFSFLIKRMLICPKSKPMKKNYLKQNDEKNERKNLRKWKWRKKTDLRYKMPFFLSQKKVKIWYYQIIEVISLVSCIT